MCAPGDAESNHSFTLQCKHCSVLVYHTVWRCSALEVWVRGRPLWSSWKPYTDNQTPRLPNTSHRCAFCCNVEKNFNFWCTQYLGWEELFYNIRLSAFYLLLCLWCWHCDMQAGWVRPRFHSFHSLFDIISQSAMRSSKGKYPGLPCYKYLGFLLFDFHATFGLHIWVFSAVETPHTQFYFIPSIFAFFWFCRPTF